MTLDGEKGELSGGSRPPTGTAPSIASGSVSFGCVRRDSVAMTLVLSRSMAVLAGFIAPGADVGVAVGPCGGIEQGRELGCARKQHERLAFGEGTKPKPCVEGLRVRQGPARRWRVPRSDRTRRTHAALRRRAELKSAKEKNVR